MPKGLRRRYGQGHLHFITCSCYRRLPLFASVRAGGAAFEAGLNFRVADPSRFFEGSEGWLFLGVIPTQAGGPALALRRF